MLAFTLLRRDQKENDQLITFYTKENGKIEAFAKGVKKIASKNSTALDPFSLLDIEIISGKELAYVTKVSIVQPFFEIRSSLKKNLIAGFVFNLVNNSVSYNFKDEKLFYMIQDFLESLVKEKNSGNLLIESFMVKLWERLGLAPVIENCVKCGKNDVEKKYFSSSEGGIVCIGCNKSANSIELKTSVQTVFHKIRKFNFTEINNLIISPDDNEVFYKIIKSFYEYHNGHNLPNWKKFLSLA